MKRLLAITIVCTAITLTANAQGRDWMTDNADPQRSAWIRTDNKISREKMQQPGFQFLWKMKLDNEPRQLNALMPPATLDRLIGFRGFRMLGFFAGSANKLFTIDTDLGRMEWEKTLKSAAPSGKGTLACPGGITTGVARPVRASIPPTPANVSGPGRNTPAKSAVGEPGKGAVTLANVRPNPPAPAAGSSPVNPMLVQNRRVNPADPPGGQLGAGPFLVYALAGDGMFHSLHLSNGADYQPPTKFIPPHANASGLTVIDDVAYVATQGGCNGAANGIWALDLLTKDVKSWKGNVAGATGMAFGGDGTIYATTASGGDKPNSLVALDAKTLAIKASFSGAQEFTSAPVIFLHKEKTLIAAATRDGRIHVFDSANLSAPLASTDADAKAFAPTALASWQESGGGTRWLLVPTDKAVVAWKIIEQKGKLSLHAGWTHEVNAPLVPTIINGVVFVTASGEFRPADNKGTAKQRAAKSGRAVLYALDGVTGKQLWSSGATITSFTRGNALAGGMSQIYLTTHDGTVYAFGYPMEH